MTVQKKIVHVIVALGLGSGAIVATTGAAVAATPSCETSVVGVLPNGKLVDRWVKNTSLEEDHVSTAPLPFAVNNMVSAGSDAITGGRMSHVNTFTSGGRPHTIDVTRHDNSADLTVAVAATYQRSFGPRLVAGSGRYYVYTIDGHGRLKRWTRERDSAGRLWFDSPKLVARHLGSLKTLSYSWTYKVNGGWRDFLYGTTRGGALKQLQVPWHKPAKAKITTIKKSGFSSYTGLSLAFCGTNANYISIVAIDRKHNRARWYTVSKVLRPGAAHVTRRGLVAPGMDWRLHATF
jgi:hypothetical protein